VFDSELQARAAQKSRLDDVSPAGLAKTRAITKSQLSRLQAFNRSALGPKDQVSYDVVLYGLQASNESNARFAYGTPGGGQPYQLCQLAGIYSQGPSFLDTQHIIETKADADAYLARLEAMAITMTQEIDAARQDIGVRVVPPDFALAKTLLQMNQLRAPAADKSTLVESLARRTKEKQIPGDWSAASAKIVRDKFYPALEQQIALIKEMQKGASHDAGVWRLPDGDAYYRASLKSSATTDKEPAEIHRLGLEVVADTTAKIDALMKKQGLTKGTVGERMTALGPAETRLDFQFSSDWNVQ